MKTDEEIAREGERIRRQLGTGVRASEIANRLHREGYQVLEIVKVVRAATPASLADLKHFGKWWGPDGVTDVAAFDAWGESVFGNKPS